MDKIRCHYAVIGFSPDLTDPTRRSIPVAVVGAGEADENRNFIFMLAATNAPVDDPVAREILAGIPKFIRDQVDLGLQKFGSKGWLSWLTQHMTQSLHVTRLEDRVVEAPLDDYLALVGAFIRKFQNEIAPTPFVRPSAGAARNAPRPASFPAFALEPVPAGHEK